jgi:hypothetical protein
LKYLVISKWKPESNPELGKRMKKWRAYQKEEPCDYVLEPHRMIGRCNGFFIVEGDDHLRKEVAFCSDLVEYEVIPIISAIEGGKRQE